MSVDTKPTVVIYTGHDEMIGGDVHYTFDLANKLIINGYRAKILTDKNKLFSKRANAWLKVQLPIEYLDTSPKLFSPHFFDRLYKGLKQEHAKQKLSGLKKALYTLLRAKLASKHMYWYFKVITRLLSLTYVREHFKNFLLFNKVMKDPEYRDAIFHFNNGGFPAKVAGIWGMWAAKRAGVRKIVMTVHNIAARRRFPRDIVCDAIARKCCDVIITASDAVRNELIRKRKIPAHLCQTIRCGLDDAQPLDTAAYLKKRKDLDIEPECPVLLISGNYEEERKGHRQLLQALAKVKQKFPHVLLLIVGSGGTERKDLLDKDIEKLGILKNVRFLGYRTDIMELNCIANISLTPSTGVESIPYTIIEGARMGTPVITTNIGGCSEAVIERKSGFVVNPGDIDMLAGKIICLLADSALQKSMGKQARELFLQHFLLDKVAKKHFKVYFGS